MRPGPPRALASFGAVQPLRFIALVSLAAVLAGCGTSHDSASTPRSTGVVGTTTVPITVGANPNPPKQGSATPLRGKLTPANQAALAAATASLATVTDVTTPGLPARAAAAATACGKLDTGKPLLAALARACGPLIEEHKLIAVLPKRCATPDPVCVKTLKRLSATTTQVNRTQRAYATLAARLVPSPACVAALAAGPAQRQAVTALGREALSVARAAESKKQGSTGAAQAGLLQLTTTLGNPNLDGGPAAVRTRELSRACAL